MPSEIEQRLKREASAKFPGDKRRQDAYVYGTLRHKLGWKPLRIKRKDSKDSKGEQKNHD